MNSEHIMTSRKEDYDFIDDRIIEYNREQIPFTQEPAFIPLNRIIRSEKGEIIAGINAMLYCWRCMTIDVLWVKEEHRRKGYGERLLQEMEHIAIEEGCAVIQLDTFDFQAKDFYLKNGYVVFGELEDCPVGHTRYYMKKNLVIRKL